MLRNNYKIQLSSFFKGGSIRQNDRSLNQDLQRGQLSPVYPYPTDDGYNGFMTIQDMVPEQDNDAKAEILNEVIEGAIAWVEYNSAYDKKPGTFKLIKENDQWKVTSKGPRGKGPFQL